jgi:hypothetical protein
MRCAYTLASLCEGRPADRRQGMESRLCDGAQGVAWRKHASGSYTRRATCYEKEDGVNGGERGNFGGEWRREGRAEGRGDYEWVKRLGRLDSRGCNGCAESSQYVVHLIVFGFRLGRRKETGMFLVRCALRKFKVEGSRDA